MQGELESRGMEEWSFRCHRSNGKQFQDGGPSVTQDSWGVCVCVCVCVGRIDAS